MGDFNGGQLVTNTGGVHPVTMVSRCAINTLEPIAKTARERYGKAESRL